MNYVDAAQRILRTQPAERDLISIEEAGAILRCGRLELEEIVAVLGGPRSLDRWDICNIALYSGSRASVPELGLRILSRLIGNSPVTWSRPMDVDAVLTAECPTGTCDGGDWRAPSFEGTTLSPLETDGQHFRLKVQGRTAPRELGLIDNPALVEIWHEFLSSFNYQYVPYSLSDSFERTRAASTGDCIGASALLDFAMNERGFQSRIRKGFCWGGTRATYHKWIEVIVEGTERALDPSMAALAHAGLLPAGLEAFCFGNLLGRVIPLRSDNEELVHNCERFEGPVGFSLVEAEEDLRRQFRGVMVRPREVQ